MDCPIRMELDVNYKRRATDIPVGAPAHKKRKIGSFPCAGPVSVQETTRVAPIFKRRAIDSLDEAPAQKKRRICPFSSVNSVTKLFNNLDVNSGTPPQSFKRKRDSQELTADLAPCVAAALVEAKVVSDMACKSSKGKEELQQTKVDFQAPEHISSNFFLMFEDKVIPVDMEVLSQHSLYFKELFCKGLGSGQNTFHLRKELYQPLQDCIHTISGTYKANEEKEIYRALGYLSCLVDIKMDKFLESGESAIIGLLDRLLPSEEEVICDINETFYDEFCQGLFPKLREKIMEFGRPMLIEASQDIELNVELGGARAAAAVLELVESLIECRFPCYDSLVDLFIEKGFVAAVCNRCSEEIVTQFFMDLNALEPGNEFVCNYLYGSSDSESAEF